MMGRMAATIIPFFQWRRAADLLTARSALLICALFLLAGVLFAGDYGISTDEKQRRENAIASLNYILGNAGVDELPPYPDRVFGVSFELPLLLAERALGVEGLYPVHRLRATLTNLFFIIGAFFCYLLTWRLFNNRLIALLALLLFLLHPRLYAHSFFNSKDLPFLSMFIIVLYLLERAFRKDTAGAFIVLGLAVGVLTDLRIMGVMLLPAVIGMRGLDLLGKGAQGRRKHILVTAGLFALVAGLTPFALLPYAWSHPVDFLTVAMNLTVSHPYVFTELFQGERLLSTERPPYYVPVWFAITTPPSILLLGFIGIAAVVGRGSARPGAIFGNTGLRFQFLLLACFVLPPLAVAVLGSNIFDDWRHLYFIYAPFCLLAVLGLRWLADFSRRLRWRVGVYGLTGVGLGLTVFQMAQLHPHQELYFNFLVDRNTPERLRTQYNLVHWGFMLRDGLEHLLAIHPGETLAVRVHPLVVRALPEAARQRLIVNSNTREPDYILVWRNLPAHQPDLDFNAKYSRRIYSSTVLTIKAMPESRMDPAAVEAYRELYRQAAAQEPIVRADYNVYRQGRLLTFIREDCPPGDLTGNFGVKVFPADPESVPGDHSLERHSFIYYGNSGVRLGRICLAVIQLPDYAISDIIVAQYHPQREPELPRWAGVYSFSGRDWADFIAEQRRNPGQPVQGSGFAVFLDNGGGRNRLLYYKRNCQPEDQKSRLLLHLYPSNPADLPPQRREAGFDNRDFLFAAYGGQPGGDCLLIVPLLDYPIAEITTGQEGRWEISLYPLADLIALPAADAALTDRMPDATGRFDLYLRDKELAYRRESCTVADTDARFFLHIVPDDAADLLTERRGPGFDNRDFAFARWGGHFDGKCLAIVPLPDYPIAAIRTGQWTAEQGELWAAELTAAGR